MVEALITALRRLLLLAALPCTSDVFAHRLDEYLQATIVAIEPAGVRLQINLTPGVDVAGRVLDRIDRDHDSSISKNEAAAYAESLKRDLTLRVDGRKLKLKLRSFEFPALTELRGGSGIIQLEFFATHEPLAIGAHKLTLENRHLLALSVYLLNAAQPKSGTIQIIRQKRNETQDTGEIEFSRSAFATPGSP